MQAIAIAWRDKARQASSDTEARAIAYLTEIVTSSRFQVASLLISASFSRAAMSFLDCRTLNFKRHRNV